MPARKPTTPQQKFTLPPPDRRMVEEAMEWDGAESISAFVLASVRRNARRILREKQRILDAEAAEKLQE